MMLPPEKIELVSLIDKRLITNASNINIQLKTNSYMNFMPQLLSLIDKTKIELESILGIEPI